MGLKWVDFMFVWMIITEMIKYENIIEEDSIDEARDDIHDLPDNNFNIGVAALSAHKQARRHCTTQERK